MFIEVVNTRGNAFLLNIAKIISIDKMGDDAVSINFAFDRVPVKDADGNDVALVQETRCALPIPYDELRRLLIQNGAVMLRRSTVDI